MTLAYWLDCSGFSPTIVEKRPNLQDRGYMIDFYGSGLDVADKMNLVDHLRDRQAKLAVLTRVARDAGWVVPQLVEDTRQAEEFFMMQWLRYNTIPGLRSAYC